MLGNPTLLSLDATKELREKLNERGIEWHKSMYLRETFVDCETAWMVNGIKWCAIETHDGKLILRPVERLTPDEVIEGIGLDTVGSAANAR